MLLCVCVFVRFGLLALSSTFTGNLRFIRLLCYGVGATEKKKNYRKRERKERKTKRRRKKKYKSLLFIGISFGGIFDVTIKHVSNPLCLFLRRHKHRKGWLLWLLCVVHRTIAFILSSSSVYNFFFLLSFVWTAKHLWAVYYRTLLVYTQHAHTHVSLLNKRNFWLGIIMLRCVFTSPQQWPSLTLFFLYIFAISPAISGQRWRSVVFNLLD